jgi:hypothetical protein
MFQNTKITTLRSRIIIYHSITYQNILINMLINVSVKYDKFAAVDILSDHHL